MQVGVRKYVLKKRLKKYKILAPCLFRMLHEGNPRWFGRVVAGTTAANSSSRNRAQAKLAGIGLEKWLWSLANWMREKRLIGKSAVSSVLFLVKLLRRYAGRVFGCRIVFKIKRVCLKFSSQTGSINEDNVGLLNCFSVVGACSEQTAAGNCRRTRMVSARNIRHPHWRWRAHRSHQTLWNGVGLST